MFRLAQRLQNLGSVRPKARFILVLGVAAVVTMILIPKFAQDPDYHQFADERTLLGIPNFWNVVSNIPFLIVGLFGLARVRERPYQYLFMALLITGAGSMYYHWAPSNGTLVLDRIGLALTIMSVLGIVIMERIDEKIGARLMPLWLAIGAGSVLYWIVTENAGAGDIRFYALVQFFPILAIPLMLALFPPKYSHGECIMIALAWYTVAKAAELMDPQILGTFGLLSGHTLKHLFAGLGAVSLYRMAVLRTRISHSLQGTTSSPDGGEFGTSGSTAHLS